MQRSFGTPQTHDDSQSAPGFFARLGQRLRALVYDFDFESSEASSGLIAFFFGLWLFNPFWDTFPSSVTYYYMALVASEWLWGLVIAGAGAGQLLALVREKRHWRVQAAMGQGVLWLVLVISFAASNISSTAVPTYFIVALNAGWAHLRLLRTYEQK